MFMGLIKKMSTLDFVAYPVEIANLASFLASDDAANITGSIIVSDTGVLVKSEMTPSQTPPTQSQ